MDNDILSQLVSDYGIMSTNEQTMAKIHANNPSNMTRPTGFSTDLNPYMFVDPYDPTLGTPTPEEHILDNPNSLDELNSVECKYFL